VPRVSTVRCAEIVRARAEPLYLAEPEESVALAAELLCLRELLRVIVDRWNDHGGASASFASLVQHVAAAIKEHDEDEADAWP